MRWSDIDAVPCPVAQGMSVIGDAWTMLIVRDCFAGASKFEEFLQRTRASRAILSERLARLVEHGVLERRKYQDHPPRYDYHLTASGRALRPVMMTLSHWAETQFPERAKPRGRRHTTCGHRFEPVVHCSHCGDAVAANEVTYDKIPGIPAPAADPKA